MYNGPPTARHCIHGLWSHSLCPAIKARKTKTRFSPKERSLDRMARRELTFQNFDDVIADVKRLEAEGYQAHGKWDLSQICEHLADWMSYPMDGFPKSPLFVRWMLAILRATVGKTMLKDFTSKQKMKENQPTIPNSVHSSQDDARKSVERLLQLIERFRRYRGELHPSPLFGALDHEQATKLQLAHCAHHLSFLEPTS
jgi:hypothetical protein